MKSAVESRIARCLVIGCGSPLRGDDAAGLRVAEQVLRWKRPDVRAIPTHQWTPELASDLAACDRAIFVDASVRPLPDVNVARLAPDAGGGRASGTHRMDPRGLLELTARLYGRAPEAWLVEIPAESFGLAAPIGKAARRHMQTAMDRIRELVEAPDA